MDWLPFALIAPVLMTVINYGDKFLVSNRRSNPLAVLTYMTLVNIGLGLGLWTLTGFVLLPVTDMLVLMLAGAAIIWGNVSYFTAMAQEEASRIIVMIRLQSVVVLLLSGLFLGETLTLRQLVGFSLILLASTAVTIERKAKGPMGVRLQPSKSFWLMVIAACFWGSSAVLADSALARNVSDFASLAVATAQNALGYAMGGIVLFLIFPGVRRAFLTHRPLLDRTVIAGAFVVEVVFLIRQFVLFTALTLGPVALVSVIGSTQVFVGVLFGWLLTLWLPRIFDEDISRSSLLRKAAWAGVTFIGILLLG